MRCENPPKETDINQNSKSATMKSSIKTTTTATVRSTTTTESLKCPEWYNCLNGGTCVIDIKNGPKCLCSHEYEGLNCGKREFILIANCANEYLKCHILLDFKLKSVQA